MKIRCETWQEKEARLSQWQRFFAWYPVRVGRYVVWLETAYRKALISWDGKGGMVYEYRATAPEAEIVLAARDFFGFRPVKEAK